MILKTIEKIIHDQTIEHLTDNQILYRYQSGCQNQSVKTNQHSYLKDKILTGFDSGFLTQLLLIDLQKVFDTTNLDILSKKMPFVGFSVQ